MRLSTYLIGIPVVVVAGVVAIANRQLVTFTLDPFSLSNPAPEVTVHLPLFVLLLLAVALGALVGGAAAHLSRMGRDRGEERFCRKIRLAVARRGFYTAGRMSNDRFPSPIFVALDTPDLGRAREVAAAVKPHVGGLKVGLEFITALGPEGIARIVELGLPVFADVKFHDIPNTVAGASKALGELGIEIFNVHASGGAAMMRAAAEAAATFPRRPKVIAVTVLTSLTDQDLESVGQSVPAAGQVTRLARLAQDSGLDGVVCSPQEIGLVRAACGPDFLIVTPGVRPAGAERGDQRRVMTPGEAVKAGANILVIGRPIMGAKDPAQAAKAIAAEVAAVQAV